MVPLLVDAQRDRNMATQMVGISPGGQLHRLSIVLIISVACRSRRWRDVDIEKPLSTSRQGCLPELRWKQSHPGVTSYRCPRRTSVGHYTVGDTGRGRVQVFAASSASSMERYYIFITFLSLPRMWFPGAPQPGTVVDLAGGRHADGTVIQLWGTNGTVAQFWLFQDLPLPSVQANQEESTKNTSKL